MTSPNGGTQSPSSTAAAAQVAATAAEQARDLAAEATTQARDLVGEARTQLRDQAAAQKEKAASSLRSFADEMRGMAEAGSGGGVATEFARQAAERTQQFATWLDQRDSGGILDDAREFARRRPGAFLLGAALAGVAAGRLTRGIAGAAGDSAPAPVRPTAPPLPRQDLGKPEPAGAMPVMPPITPPATTAPTTAPTTTPTTMPSTPSMPLSGANAGDTR